MDTDTILGLLDEKARIQAFDACLKKLESGPRLDLEALRVCVKLRPHSKIASGDDSCITPPQDRDHADASIEPVDGPTLNQRLCSLLTARIPLEPLDSDHFYELADILCVDGPFANLIFREHIHVHLVALLPALSERVHRDTEIEAQAVRSATAYLTLIKCSYWLPSSRNHVIDSKSLSFLSQFMGLPLLDHVIHDAISAFLSLLRRGERIIVASPADLSQAWLKLDPVSGQIELSGSLIDGSLWNQLKLASDNKTMGKPTSMVFRTWYQWISQAAQDKLALECLHDDSYWDKIRIGLFHGHADQRKYCIGVIRQSLLATQSDIHTPTMQFRIAERANYMRAYDQYSALFETVVLDRYPNQVQACLPELTKLMQSEITPLMACTLLSAALNHTVQEGVRKIIGNWYIDYVSKVEGDVSGHVPFFLEGFLPWATSGDLFNSTLIATRNTTNSPHGALLSDVVARFVLTLPHTAPSVEPAALDIPGDAKAVSDRRTFVSGVLSFILDARGKLFQYSILYLLEGLVKGLRACSDDRHLHLLLTPLELDKVSRIARLPGLPEIAGDLYREYCAQICDLTNPGWLDMDSSIFQQIGHETQRRKVLSGAEVKPEDMNPPSGGLTSLQALRQQLEASNHRCIQGDDYAPMCKGLISILDCTDPLSVSHSDLYSVVEAFWEEADRRQFSRAVAVYIPSILFHQTCVRACIVQQQYPEKERVDGDLCALLTRALAHLQRLSEGRIYILSMLATSLRKAISSYPELINVLPFEDYILRFINHPPTIRSEFLFEVVAAEKLQQYQPHRTYHSYYGAREWHAYAAIIDLLQRFPADQTNVAKRILDTLLEPWKLQRPGIPIISKWKNVFQLQAMLCLADFCIEEPEADAYLSSFRHALTLEAWPRHRFLLEWIIARIHYRFPGKASRILEDLSTLDESSSAHIASLMKLGVLVAPRETEDFAARFMTLLVPFSASPRVQIRHESNYAIPIVFDLALSQGWKSITDNPAFVSLNMFIRSLDKFQSTPWTIRTLKLDAVNDFTLVNIFQGPYLTIESPEKDRVAYEDFISLQQEDHATGLSVPAERIPLGKPLSSSLVADKQSPTTLPHHLADTPPQSSPAFFQTKSGFDMSSLNPHSGPPSSHNRRPASIILVASLIDNPTNLGGLSRISESFGLEALYINDVKHTAHKDFKATSVTSEKHFPIHECKVAEVPRFLLDMKTQGYEVVGVEQTDQSGILGTEKSDLGILPRKCVLVLGSEKGGISAEVLAIIDRCVEIRTVGVTRSLNVQTAGGIAVYEWWRKWYGKT